MEVVFQTVLQMSVRASLVILAVLVVRLLLKKAPRKYSYLLWAVVGFRLICPVSVASVVSIFNVVNKAVPAPMVQISEGPDLTMPVTIPAIPQPIEPGPVVMAPTQAPVPIDWFGIAAVVWCIGIVLLLGYAIISVLRLRRRLSTAVRLEGNIYQSEFVASPFILGLFRPRIYVPYGLEEQSLTYVLAHERTHLRHGDHIVKLLSFALLAVHWFNPLVWLAFVLMSRDMEMRCDEAVLAQNSYSPKLYSETLLSFAVKGRFPAPVPLAFGETAVKSRIKNTLCWKRPKVWVTALAVLLCVLALVACGTSAKEPEGPLSVAEAVQALFDSAEWDGDTFRFTIPAGYETPEDWVIQLKDEFGTGVHPVNQEKRTVWEAGKTYEVDGSDIQYLKIVVWLPGPDGKQVRYESNKGRELPFSSTGYGIKHELDLASLEIYGVSLGNSREQVIAAMGQPAEETTDEYANNILRYELPDNGQVTYYLWKDAVESIKAESHGCDWLGSTMTTDDLFARFGDPDGASYSQKSASVNYTRRSDALLGIGERMSFGFTVSDGMYTPDGTFNLYRVVNNFYRPSALVYSENVYTKDWWVSIDPTDYGITAEELAANPLPDFDAMSLEALGAYALHTDGAGAEGSFSEFYDRFLADPITVLEYLSSLGWQQDPTGLYSFAVTNLCNQLVRMGHDFPPADTFLTTVAKCLAMSNTSSRQRDLLDYLETEFEQYSSWAELQH